MTLKLICIATLAVAAWSDLKTKRIPYWTAALLGCCSAVQVTMALTDKTESLYMLLLSVLPGLLLLGLSVMSRGAVGAGDGLLLAAAGPVFGLKEILTLLMIALLLSAVVSAVLLLLKKADRKARIPFVPFLTTAMGVVLFAVP
ncbi:MAG: prepilin peptidase [Lachnospiraceae bacterium]|nr:prepilin peptidase [Lachnospiraceae bacterium]